MKFNKGKYKLLAGGELRFIETISDLHYRFIKKMGDIRIGKKYKLKDIIKHDALFKKYPEFSKIIVTFEDIPNEKIGAFAEAKFPTNKILDASIRIGLHFSYYKKHGHEKYSLKKTDFPEYSKEAVLLHEIEHVLQLSSRGEIGQSYNKAFDAACRESACDNERDAKIKGVLTKVEEVAEIMHNLFLKNLATNRAYIRFFL